MSFSLYVEISIIKFEAVYISFAENALGSRNIIGQEILTHEYVCVKVHFLFQNANLFFIYK